MSIAGGFAKSIGSGMVKFAWQDQRLFQNIDRGDEKVREGLFAVMAYKAPQVEAHMKTNAPWTDQTSAARNGLQARPFNEGDNFGIILYHTVSYGIWLEVRFSGRYAIITPTIEAMGPEVMAACQRMLSNMRF